MSGDFGRTALTLGGQVLGAYIGGPIGAAVGSYLGSQAGYALFPLDAVEGPRLPDPKLTASSYGVPLLKCYGRYKVGGVVIDASEIREVRVEEEVGGKGGPSQTVVSYEYFADLAVALGEGPIVGVARIWQDGKLVYDARASADVYSLMGAAQKMEGLRVYTGSATQDPDPVFEGLRGVGAVPAYRGTAYVVFENLRLPNGILPSFQFEVFTAGSVGLGQALQFIRQYPESLDAQARPVADFDGESMVISAGLPGAGFSEVEVNVWRCWPGGTGGELLGRFTVPNLASDWDPLTLRSRSGGVVAAGYADSVSATAGAGIAVYRTDGGVVFNSQVGGLSWEAPSSGTDFSRYLTGFDALLAEDLGVYVGSSRAWTTADTENANNWHRKRVRVWRHGSGAGSTFSLPADHYSAAIDIAGADIYVLAARRDSATLCTYRLLRYDLGGTLQTAVDLGQYGHDIGTPTYPLVFGTDPVHAGLIEVDADGTAHVLLFGLKLTAGSAGRDLLLQRVAGGTLSTVVSGEPPESSHLLLAAGSYQPRFRVGATGVLVGCITPEGSGAGSTPGAYFVPFRVATMTTVTLQSIVEDLATRAGIPSARVDATALSGVNVTGTAWAGGQAMRAALEPLQAAWFFSLADVDGQIVCSPRGGAAVRTLQAADLLAADGPPLALARRDEAEAPARVALTYINADQDYDAGTQSAGRAATASTAEQQVSLPIVMADAEGAQIADKRLSAAWAALESGGFDTALDQLDLAPGDCVEVTQGTRTLRLYLAQATLSGGRIRWQAEADNAAAFTSYAVAQPAAAVSQVVDYLSASTVAALDVPILRADDDGVGFYLAAAPVSGAPGWQGASVYRRVGDDGDFASLTAITAAATIGRADTALPAWPVGEARVDPFGTVDVTLRHGTLASATDNAPHRALIGSEIVQFVTVTQLAAGQYRLGKLLRGVQGTDHLTASHQVGELFVLLSATALRLVDDAAATIGVAQTLRAVTFGRTLSGAPEIAFTNTGRRRQCLPPVRLRASPQANGDTVLQWQRAVRKYQNLRNPSAVGTEESPARSYELDITNPATGALLRTLAAVDAEQVTYTAAQIAADFGGSEFGATVDAYQLNAAGRGLRGRYTVTNRGLQPLPAVLINCSDDPVVTARLATQWPVGLWQRNTAFDTARVLFGSRSLAGGNNSQRAAQSLSGFAIGTGDWYAAAWVYLPALPSASYELITQAVDANKYTFEVGINASGCVFARNSGNGTTFLATVTESTPTLIAGAWNHVAASRSGNTLRVFANGVVRATSTGATSQFSDATAVLYIGQAGTGVNWTSYPIQEAVVVTGAAVRTANFTPVASPYTFR